MEEKLFKLRGKTLVIIDWANVYGWSKNLGWEINPQKLYDYLKNYPEIFNIRFYFGVEKNNKKSEQFQENIKNIGYTLISKEVKWIPLKLSITHFKTKDGNVRSVENALGSSSWEIFKNLIEKEIKKPLSGQFCRRKCDFDVEITKDILININNFDCLILFSGDGDYKDIIEYLLNNNKQTIVIHPFGLRGKEYNELIARDKNRPYLCAVEKLTSYLK